MKRRSLKITVKQPFRSRKKVGKAPGTITYLGTKDSIESGISVLAYNEEGIKELELKKTEGLSELIKSDDTVFYDIVGLGDEKFIEEVGNKFGLGPLLLEDVVNTNQRSKIDEYEDLIFGVFKMLYLNADDKIIYEHIALVLEKDNVLLFQETEDDVFEGVKNRIRKKYGRIRSRGADYLFFALLDAMIDEYYVVLEYLKNKIEDLEDGVYNNPTADMAKDIQMLKKEVLRVRKWVFPVKELMQRLVISDHHIFHKETKPFLRDVLDHCTEINEDLILYREMSTSLMEMHMTNMSNKMNEVMKVLTVMASIFIPLTFIAGIYGMNFEYMPELQHKHGYFYLWGIFVLIFLGMLIFFRKKGWL